MNPSDVPSDNPPGNTPMRIMLVDDHPLVRDGIRLRLQAMPHLHLDVVAEAASAEDALEQLRQPGATVPDVVISDVRMSGSSGLELAATLARLHPGVRVLILSMVHDTEFVSRAFALGVAAYVGKDAPAGDLLHALTALREGRRYTSTSLDARLHQHQLSTRIPSALTSREADVLRLVAQGKTSKAIAEALHMSVRTVETHRLSLRRKLRLDNSATLAQYATELTELALLARH